MNANRLWKGQLIVAAVLGGLAAVALIENFRATATAQAQAAPAVPHVIGGTPEETGKYLVLVAGCNDCHTPGYMEKGRAVPEELWLTGMPVGFKGPWGTTYPSNLRVFTAKYKSADEFVQVLRARNTRPPMPWESLHAMSDPDLRSLYAYIKSLPVTGTPAPDYLSPGTDPKTPYIPFTPVMPVPQRRGRLSHPVA
jgi:mono/diheme cytochrome c family protein